MTIQWDWYVNLDDGKVFAWHPGDAPPADNSQPLTQEQVEEITDRRLKETADRFPAEYSNAFWNGTQMVYGDEETKVFNEFLGRQDPHA